MALKVGLGGRKTWERYERGNNFPNGETLSRLASLGINANWLLTGMGPMLLGDETVSRLEELASIDRDLGRLDNREALIRRQHCDDPDAVLYRDVEVPRRALLQRRLEITGAGMSDNGQAAVAAPGDGFVLIPRYNVEASAGPGALNGNELVVDYMAFREDFVRRVLRAEPENLALITAIGDSMEPAIRAGDLLLVDRGIDRIMDDAIYVLGIGDELMVKRVQRFFDGGLVVKSDNIAYHEQTITAEAAPSLRVAGRVRWIGRLI